MSRQICYRYIYGWSRSEQFIRSSIDFEHRLVSYGLQLNSSTPLQSTPEHAPQPSGTRLQPSSRYGIASHLAETVRSGITRPVDYRPHDRTTATYHRYHRTHTLVTRVSKVIYVSPSVSAPQSLGCCRRLYRHHQEKTRNRTRCGGASIMRVSSFTTL